MVDSSEFKLAKPVVKQLSRRSDRKGLIQLFGHIGLLFLTTLAVSQSESGWLLMIAMLIHGIVLSFVFSPLHESIHYTAFKTTELNNLVAAVFGFLLLLPYQYFREYHSIHHRYTQSSDKDPELIGKKEFTRWSYPLHLSGLPFWWGNVKILYWHSRGKVTAPYLHERSHRTIITEARIHVGLYFGIFSISFLFGIGWLLTYWVIPLLIGQPFLRLFLLAEHSGCDRTANMLENSRTTYTSPLINFLSWNMSYHAEHHYLASVPFHALPALHAHTGQHIKFLGDGYWLVNQRIADQVKR